jgi:hypothetical protein
VGIGKVACIGWILAVPHCITPRVGAPRRALATPSRFCDDPALGRWIKGLIAMELKRCLFGCLLALASVGTATAMGVATQDPGAPHATLVDSASHDGGGSGGDATDSDRDCPLPGQPGGSADGSHGGSSGGGAATAHPRASHRSNLGWQSLLPGAIQ